METSPSRSTIEYWNSLGHVAAQARRRRIAPGAGGEVEGQGAAIRRRDSGEGGAVDVITRKAGRAWVDRVGAGGAVPGIDRAANLDRNQASHSVGPVHIVITATNRVVGTEEDVSGHLFAGNLIEQRVNEV